MLWLKAVVFAACGSYSAMGETIQAAGKMVVRALCMTLLALNFVGESLRQVMDPRRRVV